MQVPAEEVLYRDRGVCRGAAVVLGPLRSEGGQTVVYDTSCASFPRLLRMLVGSCFSAAMTNRPQAYYSCFPYI